MEWKNYSIGYGNCEVAHSVNDLAFAKAEFISIIGKNGSGKSTLLKSINYPQLRMTGQIILGDSDYDLLSNDEKAKTAAFVLTERNFSYFLKVRELLALSRAPYTSYYGKLRNEDHEIIERILDRFRLTEISDRTLGTLSDGQLQRVLIARALVQDTPYIFMDEPTSHLDIDYKVDVLVMLKELCVSLGKTIVYTTHELQLALKLSDQIINIHQGIVQQHSTADFIKSTKLKEMFPSRNISFNQGKIDFNF